MRQPAFHRWLGVELVRAADGEVEVRLPYRPEFAGDAQGHNVHGGVIATLADIAGCFAVMSAVGHEVPTLDLRMDYLRMALPGEELRAVARVLKAGRTPDRGGAGRVSHLSAKSRDPDQAALGRKAQEGWHASRGDPRTRRPGKGRR
jgi:uncharacterized protein (TIGR00369 family)